MLALLAPVLIAAVSWQPEIVGPRGRPPSKFRLTDEEWQAACPVILRLDEIKARGIVWKPRRQPNPDFPAEAMTFKRTRGWTEFLMRVDVTGTVADVQLVKASNTVFVDSSAEALLNWRYEPLVLDGKPTCVEASVYFEYDADRR